MLKPTLRFGSQGPAVADAQTRLNTFGFSTLPQLKKNEGFPKPDGQFFGNTRARVQEFQRSRDLAKIISLAFTERGHVTDHQTQGTMNTKAVRPMGVRKGGEKLRGYMDKGHGCPAELVTPLPPHARAATVNVGADLCHCPQ